MNSRLAVNADSNVWIGAWWVSFVAGAILCFVIAIPVLAFPAALPGIVDRSNY